MQIKGVSPIYTKAKNEVAFDVEGEIDAAIMRQIPQIPGVKFFTNDGRLVLRTTFEPLPVTQSHIKEFLRHYNTIEQRQQIEKENEEHQRQLELQQICESVGYLLTKES